MKTASEIADEIAMEWRRVPDLGNELAYEALKLIEGGLFNGLVPHEDI